MSTENISFTSAAAVKSFLLSKGATVVGIAPALLLQTRLRDIALRTLSLGQSR